MPRVPKKKTARAKPVRARRAQKPPRLRLSVYSALPIGRPSKYKPEYVGIAQAMTRAGMADVELAAAFNVGVSTLYRWRTEHPEFREAITGARDLPIERVERSLYQRALGYDHKATKIVVANGAVRAVEYLEHVPADVNAASLWLRNVAPDRWRDRREVAPPAPTKTEREMTTEELYAELRAIEQERLEAAKKAGAIDVTPIQVSAGTELVRKP